MNQDYLKINMVYFNQAFLFLAAGLVLLIFRGMALIPITFNSISIIWLFGFVVSMVFGITNIMMPSYTKSPDFNVSFIGAEIVFLDSGIIFLFTVLNFKSAVHVLFPISTSLLLISVFIHIYDMASATKNKGGRKIEEEVYSSHAR